MDLLKSFRPEDLLDIALMAFAVYRLLLLIKGTRAMQMLWGLVLVVPIYYISGLLALSTINSILERFAGYLILSLVVLFQEDIRRALVRVGNPLAPGLTQQEESQILEEMQQAAFTLAQAHTGALIVVEREGSLQDYVDGGTPIEGRVTRELLQAVFQTSSPIHDGAVIIQKDRVASAGCFLPLTTNPEISRALGTRHRAAIGITESTDAVVLVVSEEEGHVSLAVEGTLRVMPDPNSLRQELQKHFNLEPKRKRAIRLGSTRP